MEKCLSKVKRNAAQKYTDDLRPMIQRVQQRGIIAIRAIHDELNHLNIPTFRTMARGWHLHTVHALIQRTSARDHNIF
jgi:hypothetical protein